MQLYFFITNIAASVEARSVGHIPTLSVTQYVDTSF